MSDPYQQPNWPQQPGSGGQPYGQPSYGRPPQQRPPYEQQQPTPYEPAQRSPYGAPQGDRYGRSQYDEPQQRAPYGAPQRQYGESGWGSSYDQPPRGQFGSSQGPGSSGYGYESEPVKRGNGLATAALIFGILPTIVLGIGFGIAGLVRAAKVRSGKVRSVFGIILSVLWLIPVIYLAPHLIKASDPGCIASKETMTALGDDKLAADGNDIEAMKKDLATLVAQLNDAAAKSKDEAARSAITKLAADFNELLTDLKKPTEPAKDLQSRIDADAKALDTACGTIGS